MTLSLILSIIFHPASNLSRVYVCPYATLLTL